MDEKWLSLKKERNNMILDITKCYEEKWRGFEERAILKSASEIA